MAIIGGGQVLTGWRQRSKVALAALTALAVVQGTVVGVVTSTAAEPGQLHTQASSSEAGATGYTPMTPQRRVDTRIGVGGRARPLGAGDSATFSLAGAGLPWNATAVVLNVTAVTPSSTSFLTVWPAGKARPSSSNLNLVGAHTVANTVVVGLGSRDAVSVYNDQGRTDVLLDLQGYYAPSAGDGYVPITPHRLVDTRKGIGAAAGRLGARQVVKVTPTAPVPAGATGLVLNITAVAPTDTGFLTVYPTGSRRPMTSSVSLSPHTTRANLSVVGLSGGGFSVYNEVGTVDVVIDVQGYFLPTADGTFAPQVPARTVDTRKGTGTVARRLGPGQTITVATGGSNAGAVALNVTAVAPSAPTFLTVWPAGTSRPVTSNLNARPGEVIPNAVVVAAADGRVSIYNDQGTVDVVVDTLGEYVGVDPVFAPAPAPVPAPAPAPAPATPRSTAGEGTTYTLYHSSSGEVVRWNPCASVEYRVNVSQAPAGALSDAQTAMEKIGAAAGIDFRYGGTTTGTPQNSWVSSWPAGQAPLVISWARPAGQAGGTDLLPGGGVVGQGGWQAVSGGGSPLHIVHGYVVLDANYTALGAGFGDHGRGQLLLHEIGHAVGLDHIGDHAQLMYPSVTFTPGVLGAGDQAGLARVGRPAGCL